MLNRVFAGATALLILAVFAVPALAISNATVTFIPDKISINSPFIMIADPHAAQSDSVIVTWNAAINPDEINLRGSFPRIAGRYICYFSNTDNESTCGPSPFKSTGSRTFIVKAVNQDNTSGDIEARIPVGDINIQPTVFTPNGINISIRWPISTFEPAPLRYTVYYAKNMTATNYSGSALSTSGYGYSIDIPTGPGEYFISLRIDHDATSRFGGMLVHFKFPEGGIYSSGGPVNLVVDTASFEVLLNKGQNYQRTGFSITNVGNNEIGNLSVAIPTEYSSFLSVTLANDSIAPNGTIFYTVVIGSAQHTMEINTKVNVTSNGTVIGQIPIRINVSIVNECGGAAPTSCTGAGSGISLSPTTWTGSYLAGTPAEFNFNVSNTGNTTISNFSYASDIGSSLSVRLPATLLPNGYAPASATLTSNYGGVKSGTITINSPQGSAKMLVLAIFYEDQSSAISDLRAECTDFQINLTAAQSNALASAFRGIDSDISSAESAQKNGNYAGANEYYNKAAAKLSALKDAFSGGSPVQQPSQSTNIDFTTILIAIIIVVIAAVAFVFIRRRRRGGGEDELEEELSEDFGPPPGEEK